MSAPSSSQHSFCLGGKAYTVAPPLGGKRKTRTIPHCPRFWGAAQETWFQFDLTQSTILECLGANENKRAQGIVAVSENLGQTLDKARDYNSLEKKPGWGMKSWGRGAPSLHIQVQRLHNLIKGLRLSSWEVQFSSAAQSCPTLCNPMNCSTPGLPVHHQLRVYPNSCPLSQWCHLTISSSVVSFSSCLQSFPTSGVFSNESALCIRWPKYWSWEDWWRYFPVQASL